MSIEVDCEVCGKRVSVRDEDAGRMIKCPACHRPTHVPHSAGVSLGTTPVAPRAAMHHNPDARPETVLAENLVRLNGTADEVLARAEELLTLGQKIRTRLTWIIVLLIVLLVAVSNIRANLEALRHSVSR